MDTRDQAFPAGDTNLTETIKKTWSVPVFEIISKDIVQGGGAHGTEGTGNAS